jgi:hypothetical protein
MKYKVGDECYIKVRVRHVYDRNPDVCVYDVECAEGQLFEGYEKLETLKGDMQEVAIDYLSFFESELKNLKDIVRENGDLSFEKFVRENEDWFECHETMT